MGGVSLIKEFKHRLQKKLNNNFIRVWKKNSKAGWLSLSSCLEDKSGQKRESQAVGLGKETGRVVDKQAQGREQIPGVKEAMLRKEKKQGSYAFQSNSETLTDLPATLPTCNSATNSIRGGGPRKEEGVVLWKG